MAAHPSEIAEWGDDRTPGWTAQYRVVWCYAWLPTRIDGRWRWRIGYYALQVIYDEENPPAFWLTVARSASPATLWLGRRCPLAGIEDR